MRFCAMGIHAVRTYVWSIVANELLHGANQISYRNHQFLCSRYYLPSDTYHRTAMKEITGDEFAISDIQSV